MTIGPSEVALYAFARLILFLQEPAHDIVETGEIVAAKAGHRLFVDDPVPRDGQPGIGAAHIPQKHRHPVTPRASSAVLHP